MLSNALKPAKAPLPGHKGAFRAGIYIHWPFCERKCPYCDFNSHVRAEIDQDVWRTSLVKEIESLAIAYPGLEIASVFFGGGTPSLMPVETCDALLKALDHHFGLQRGVEITLEANPSSVEATRFKGYRAAGVNRLSMGFQSLRDESLQFLGRLHSAADAIAALKTARGVFDSVSFDLIYALPDQTLDAWQVELGEALAFGPDHLSLYQLTIEEGTAFYHKAKRGDLVIPDEDLAADFYDLTDGITRAAGLPAYEVSNHAKTGRESQHNLGYWRGQWYAGIGPGAHGRLPHNKGTHQGGLATSQIKRPEDWLKSVADTGWGGAEMDQISKLERAREQVMMGLRLSEGVDLFHVEQMLGQPIDTLIDRAALNNLLDMGLAQQKGGFLTAVGDGRLVINRLVAEILR